MISLGADVYNIASVSLNDKRNGRQMCPFFVLRADTAMVKATGIS